MQADIAGERREGRGQQHESGSDHARGHRRLPRLKPRPPF
jgi:hypothetical protein